MGRVVVDFTLSNYWDIRQVEVGQLMPDRIRQTSMRGVVDTGSARLVLPDTVARHLGLGQIGEVVVRYADQRREIRPLVRDAHVQLLGRGSAFNAIVETGRDEALIGAIVLEDLDLVVDCTGQKLIPRDPERIVAEVE